MEGVHINKTTTKFPMCFLEGRPTHNGFCNSQFQKYQTALIRNICFDCENINNLTLHLEPNNQISDSIAQKQ